MGSRAYSPTKDDSPRQQSEALVSRLPIDITALDLRIQKQVAKYGSLKDVKIVLWRPESDATGSNWNARIGRMRRSSASDLTWWDVVPQMRERFNLDY